MLTDKHQEELFRPLYGHVDRFSIVGGRVQSVVERIVSEQIEAARAECADDHGAWREEIAELKADALMWQRVTEGKVRAAERALVERLRKMADEWDAKTEGVVAYRIGLATAADHLRAALARPDTDKPAVIVNLSADATAFIDGIERAKKRTKETP